MALHGRFRGDITIQGPGGDDQFGLRWNRILFPGGMPAVHFGPATAGNEAAAADGHAEPTLTLPIDANSAPADDFGGTALGATPQADAAPPADAPGPALFWHPPYFAAEPLDASAGQSPAPGDPAAAAGLIPKSEALIWSGPAIMIFPGDAHESGSAASPDLAGTPGATGTADVPDTPAAITRADLDPVLAAMGSGADHGAASDPGGADISAAFLPPGSSDLAHPPHGLDPGFAFTPQPMPPPPPDIV